MKLGRKVQEQHSGEIVFTMLTAITRGVSTKVSRPISLFVTVRVKEDRLDEFLPVIEHDAVESRKEPGCMRFDVLRDDDDKLKFYFYEMYRDSESVEHHKNQPHYLRWSEFKSSGGIHDASKIVSEVVF